MDMLHSIPVTAQQIKQWTDRDPVLSVVQSFVQNGWPHKTVDLNPEDVKLESSI